MAAMAHPISCVSKNVTGCSDSTGPRGLSGSTALGPLGGVSCSPWRQDPTVETTVVAAKWRDMTRSMFNVDILMISFNDSISINILTKWGGNRSYRSTSQPTSGSWEPQRTFSHVDVWHFALLLCQDSENRQLVSHFLNVRLHGAQESSLIWSAAPWVTSDIFNTWVWVKAGYSARWKIVVQEAFTPTVSSCCTWVEEGFEYQAGWCTI